MRKTVGWHVDPETGKSVQEQVTLGYTATRAEGLQMLAEYNKNPFDIKASKATFQEVYERWSKEKFPTISKSNVKGYEASYRVCGTLYNKVFRDIRLMDLQFVVDTCGKNYPTLSSPCGLCSSCGETDPLVQEVQRQITCGNRQGNDHAGEQQQKMVVQTGIG